MTNLAKKLGDLSRKILLWCTVGALISGIGKKANAEFVFGEPELVPGVNSSEYGDCEASISSDGLELYFRRDTPGWNWNIWVATRLTEHHNFMTPVDLGTPVNVVGHTEGPSISADGLELYFSSSRFGAIGWAGEDTDYDIWVSQRESKNSPWQTPENLGATVNTSDWELFPCISADGTELYFLSYRPSGTIWVSKREITGHTTKGPWGEPVDLGPLIGRGSHPCISSDGLSLYFVSSRNGGYGRWDIWVTTRATLNDPWGEPVNLGPTVNTFLDESGPCLSNDDRWLFFDRFQGAGYWYSDIWQVSITPFLDFNHDGNINLEDYDELIGGLGAEGESISYMDIAPSPLGDKKIDGKDVGVFVRDYFRDKGLAAYWGFDEKTGNVAHDKVYNHHGTVYGNPEWIEDGGMVNGALSFDGEDYYVKTDFVWNPESGPFSVFAWVYDGDLGQVIISQKGEPVDSYGRTWIGIDALEKKLMTGLSTTGRGGGGDLVADAEVSDNYWNDSWHHVGVVWDGVRRNLYLDGERVGGDVDVHGNLAYSKGDLVIGAGKNLEQGSFWNGIIDDVKIYPKAFNSRQISEISGLNEEEAIIGSWDYNWSGGGNGGGGDDNRNENIEGFENCHLGDSWRSYGDASWYVTSGDKHTGNYSARAGSIEHAEVTSLELVADCELGEVSFYKKVSSEDNYDFLIFYVDGREEGRWSGEQDWDKVRFPIYEGTRTFRWEYFKDSSESRGDDTAYIDDVEFP